MRNPENVKRMEKWAVQSPEEPGFHAVITPDKCESRVAQVYRLNLNAGDSYVLESGNLEMQPALIEGKALLSEHDVINGEISKFDAFYIPGGNSVKITAIEDCIFYIGAAICEGYGKPFIRKFDISQPVGQVHQIHGQGIAQREVMMTLGDFDDASRLICGLTWGGEGSWTSWPPHQHEKDLEEVYCYMEMPLPHFGMHLSYLKSGEYDDLVVHQVHSGTFVQAPAGYHPTVACPGIRNAYFWCLASFSHSSRSYNLSVLDPELENFQSER